MNLTGVHLKDVTPKMEKFMNKVIYFFATFIDNCVNCTYNYVIVIIEKRVFP